MAVTKKIGSGGAIVWSKKQIAIHPKMMDKTLQKIFDEIVAKLKLKSGRVRIISINIQYVGK